MVQMLITSLEKYSTDYKRFKYYSIHENFIQPVTYVIGINSDECRKNNEVSLVLKNRTGIYIPVGKTLKKFLKIPNVFDKIIQYQNRILLRDPLTSILQGSLWKKILLKYSNKTVIPLTFYFDDFETCNPLGSHTGIYKLGAIYFTIASLPPKYASRIENIFLAMLFHSQDRTEFGNTSTFNILLKELKSLETEGLPIVLNGSTLNIFFVVILTVV